MTEMSYRPQVRAITTPRRRAASGRERSYVRLASIGDRWAQGAFATSVDWRGTLAATLAHDHDVSWCDSATRGATAYDVRRVQLRVASAHRPHLVALDGALRDLRRHDWDLADVRAHLTHCAAVLSRCGAVLVTTSVGARGRWHRTRGAQLDELYDELHARFDTIHVEHAASSRVVVARVLAALADRGFEARA